VNARPKLLLLAMLGLTALGQTAWAEGPPFMKGLAAERGETLPMPYGFALVYSNTQQDLELDNFAVTANGNPASAAGLVHLGDSDLKSSSVLLKGDVWLLPFLDLFAFAGKASNKLKADYTLYGDEVASYFGSTACNDPSDRPAFCDRQFHGSIDRDTDAVNYGGGVLLAYAKGPAFGLLSLIYATSDASSEDTKIKAFTASPRAGWRFRTQTGGSVAAYVGASFVDSKVQLDNQQVIETGSPGNNVPEEIVFDYSISQKNEDSWSYLAGVNWDISRQWTLQGEYAVGGRQGLLTSLVWRFGG
jgi:opacity protein-like surface antigen